MEARLRGLAPNRLDPGVVVAVAFLAGIAIRILARNYVTVDWALYLAPWYDHARLHGFAGLKQEFTDYTPFYSYCLIAAAKLDGFVSPVLLVKSISYVFELGCALVGARLVALVDPRPPRAAFAFAALWLSPTVLHNGAFWGQCDAIWTFFLLLSTWAVCVGRTRWAILAFGIAFSVKVQAVFFGPFLFGIVLRRRENLLWFGLVPLVYLALAVPSLLAGRPFGEVVSIYLAQTGFFRDLWKGAANLYNLVPGDFYRPGLEIGLTIAAAAGLGLSVWIARARTLSREGVLLAAALSLALMPFLLPKMHDRFFYAFDAMIVILACLRPLYIPVALAALVSSRLCYLPFDGYGDFGQAVTGLQTLVILLYLRLLFRRAAEGRPVASADPERDKIAFLRPIAALWSAYLLYSAGRIVLLALIGTPAPLWPKAGPEPIGLTAFLICLCVMLLWLRRALPSPLPRPVPAG